MTQDHEQLRRLYEYWRMKAAGRRFPLRAEIDPLDLGFALGNLLLVDALAQSPPRFRYRLWGINLTTDYGRDMTGLHVDELSPPELAAQVQAAYVAVVQSGLPSVQQFNNVISGRRFTHERMLLPLGTDAAPDRVGMILGGIFRDADLGWAALT